jgi:hypothetical protein|tara:strand:- start:2476 stop:2817 length:342 start_codon:yes stop_codon:yes gene_type:complete
MKITKSQLKEMIKEEFDSLDSDSAKLGTPDNPHPYINVTEDGMVVLGFPGSDARHVLQKDDAQKFAEDLMGVLKLNEARDEKDNPWAICTASVGREDEEKYERCVKSVKKEKK